MKPPPTDDLTRAQIAELRAREGLWNVLAEIGRYLLPIVVMSEEKIREDLKKPD